MVYSEKTQLNPDMLSIRMLDVKNRGHCKI
jgi:hypothetical protein